MNNLYFCPRCCNIIKNNFFFWFFMVWWCFLVISFLFHINNLFVCQKILCRKRNNVGFKINIWIYKILRPRDHHISLNYSHKNSCNSKWNKGKNAVTQNEKHFTLYDKYKAEFNSCFLMNALKLVGFTYCLEIFIIND